MNIFALVSSSGMKLEGILFGASLTDPAVFAGVTAALAIVVLRAD